MSSGTTIGMVVGWGHVREGREFRYAAVEQPEGSKGGLKFRLESDERPDKRGTLTFDNEVCDPLQGTMWRLDPIADKPAGAVEVQSSEQPVWRPLIVTPKGVNGQPYNIGSIEQLDVRRGDSFEPLSN